VRDNSDAELLDAFVRAFGTFDDMVMWGHVPVGELLADAETDEFGLRRWRPRQAPTSRAALDGLYRQLPHGLPTLFEDLLLRWRWAAVDIGAVQLLANPVGPDLGGFADEVLNDGELAELLIPAGYVQFGRVGGGGYDPVCFDIARGRTADDARVVQFDHEELLCHRRLGSARELQPSFRHLVTEVVAAAAQSPRSSLRNPRG